MWKALKNLFQNNNDQRKLALKDKLRKIKEEGETVPTYLEKFTQCQDELGSVGVNVAYDDLVSLTLLCLPKSLHSYQDSINGREKLLDWERLWSDLVQEEFVQNTRDGSSSKTNYKEDCALESKEKKAKGKKSQGKEGKRGLSKIICFHCHKHGHYASNFPQKKASKKEPIVAVGETLDSHFELDFNLISCIPTV